MFGTASKSESQDDSGVDDWFNHVQNAVQQAGQDSIKQAQQAGQGGQSQGGGDKGGGGGGIGDLAKALGGDGGGGEAVAGGTTQGLANALSSGGADLMETIASLFV